MEVKQPVFPGLQNHTRVYSPITLNREWPALARLATVVFVSCFGATLNGYFVSSFFVDHDLKRLGNVYQACAGLADMLVTSAVLPISAVVLLSGEWDQNPVCHVLQTLVACSTYCYSMYFPLISGEIYFRVCHTPKRLRRSASVGIAIIAILVFLVGVTLAATGTYLALDYDYCQRLHFGNYYFRNSTSIGIHGISFLFTMYTLIASSIQIRRQHLLQPRYRKSSQYHRDVSMIQLNFMAYLMHVTFWIPYLIVVNVFPSAPDAWYYPSAWAGVSRPLFTSMFYGSLNRMFGRAYSNIFSYCCCKSSMHSYPRRQRRAFDYYARPVNSDVRIHILQHALNINGPQRASSSTRETTEL